MGGRHVPLFNVFDPVGSWLNEISSSIALAGAWLFSEVMKWIANQAQLGFDAPYLLNSYKFTISLAFFVGLPAVLIKHFVDVKARRSGVSDLWDVLLKRLPRFMALSVFGLAIGTILTWGIARLNNSIIEWTMQSTAEELAETYSNLIVATLLMQGIPVLIAWIAGLLVVLSVITLFVFTLLVSVAAQVLAIFLPLALLTDLTHGYRGVAKKFTGFIAVALAATPIQLLLLGFFMNMLIANADALTTPGAVDAINAGQSPLANIGLLVVSAGAFLLPVAAPLALANLLNTGTSRAGSSKSGTTSAGTSSRAVSGPQQAAQARGGATGSSGAGAGVSLGAGGPAGSSGVSAAQGAAGASAASAGAARGAAGTGGAVAAGAAGVATAGVGTAVVAGASAAARMASAARADVRGRTQATVQQASMAAMHLEHRDEG